MHAALAALYDESGRLGLRDCLPVELEFVPSSEVGQMLVGADAAARELIRAGLLREMGEGLGAHFVVDDLAVVGWRRSLMTLEPRSVALLQRAGERWAALASTCAKNAENAPMSPASMVASGAA